eukprot:2617964-Amphidinium_carterae.1
MHGLNVLKNEQKQETTITTTTVFEKNINNRSNNKNDNDELGTWVRMTCQFRHELRVAQAKLVLMAARVSPAQNARTRWCAASENPNHPNHPEW